MKKNAFTLIELLAVIVIIGLAITLIAVKIEHNINDAKKLASENQIEMIETAAELYVQQYSSELSTYNTTHIASVSVNTLMQKGLIAQKDISNIDTTTLVYIANINGTVRLKYDAKKENKNIIFIQGTNNMALSQNATYNELGAHVLIINTGIVELPNANISSNVNTSIKGNYTVTYTYTNADSVVRNVKIV